jgi:hypothetical protein
MRNENMPEGVFGSKGLFARACARVYGARAGDLLARYFDYSEKRAAGELPDFYPRQIHATSVLWRYLEDDRLYWGAEPSVVEQQALARLKLDRAGLQRRLAELWRQTAAVNETAGEFLIAAAEAGDLREDARQDLARLRLCNEAGRRAARLLSAYHAFRAGSGNAGSVLAMSSEFLEWMRRNLGFDFTDPKGGDSASWIEAAELLRGELLAVAQ